MARYLTFAAAILFAVAGVTVGCMDLRDHLTVPPTPGTPDAIVQPAEEPLTINQAKREVEVVVADTARWVRWREQDIAKREQLVGFIEGFASSGLTALGETAGTWAGPFAPLVALGIGYLTKRRKDRDPDEVRQEKEDSYNKGLEAGRVAAEAVRASIATD